MEISALIYIGLTIGVVALAMLVGGQTGAYTIRKTHDDRSDGQQNSLMQTMYTGIGLTRQQLWNRYLVLAVFILLFAVSACRIAVGNDYWVYRSDFLLIQQNRETSFEWGFVWVVKALQAVLDYDQYLPIFAFFSFFTVLFFVRGMSELSDWFGYTVFLLMTSGYYFSSLNSVRYYLVLAIALYSIRYVLSGDWIRFVLLICVGALFHKSVLVVIPLYFIASRKWNKWYYIVLAVFVGSLVIVPGVYRKIIFYFYPFYEGSLFDTGETSITNIARCAAVLILALIYYRQTIRGKKANEFYFICNLGALLLYVFASFIPEISRIGYYLNITNILLIPSILRQIPGKKQRLFWISVTTVAFVGYFALFLRSAYSTDIRLLPYRNWIFQ